MKLVWLVNTLLPQIAKAQGKKQVVIGGWTVQLADVLSNDPDIDLTVFYPQHEVKGIISGNAGKIRYAGFFENAVPELKYNSDMTEMIRTELLKIKPDIVHIWGTEFTHTLSMVRAFARPERTVISIQGLVHKIGPVYDSGLPDRIISRHTFRDLIRHDSIREQRDKFLRRGEYETAALKEVCHVIGRTEWDRNAVLSANSALKYHHAGEILRESFYKAKKRWDPAAAEKHRIFITQCYYPIKGMHFVLNALSKVKRKYPDTVIAVSGKNMFPGSVKELIKQDSYGKYICELIMENGLKNSIEFLGEQDEAGMVDQYLRCSAFLLPSVIENSSNSLGEAMMLGVPCIAGAVGGTPDMMRSDEGWLYDHKNIDELSSLIIKVFDITDREKKGEDTGLNRILERAAEHASDSYDIEKNTKSYIKLYDDMMNENAQLC